MNQVSTAWHQQIQPHLTPLRETYENVRASIKREARPSVKRGDVPLSQAFEMTVRRLTDVALKPLQKLDNLFPALLSINTLLSMMY